MRRFLDITFQVFPAMTVWPGDAPTEIESLYEVEKGDRYMVSRLVLSSHAGTHVDAPAHYIEGGDTVESLRLSTLIGPCVVAGVEDREITAGVVDSLALPPGVRRVLFKTANSGRFAGEGPFARDYVGVSACGASRLVDMGVELVGSDYLSVAAFDEVSSVHRIFLGAGVVLLETLNLKDVSPGRYELLCLPLKLRGVEGSPCRAVLITDDS